MSLRKFLKTSFRNVVLKKLYSAEESNRSRHIPDMAKQLKECAGTWKKEIILENEAIHEKFRKKRRQVKKQIDKVIREIEAKQDLPGVSKNK